MIHSANKIILVFLIFWSVSYAQQKDSLSEKKSIPVLTPMNELRDQLDDLFNDSNFSSALWGVIVKSLKTGEVVYKRNAD